MTSPALIQPESYEPKAVFSPSQLSRAARCFRSWGFRYLLGFKRREPKTWAEACALAKPAALIKSKPTKAERDAVKAYNRVIRPALGKECHARLEHYFKGGDVDWNDKPGRTVLAGMHLLPHPDECELVEAEGEITIEVDGVRFKAYRDLLTCKAGVWLLVDHKTTYTFDYFDQAKTQRTIKTPEQLKQDAQANLYAFDVMSKHGLTELACRWVYYRTEGAPAAVAVDFTITLAEATAVVAELVAQAKALAAIIESAANDNARAVRLPIVQALPASPEACDDFGGCEYHESRGGPCSPPTLSAGERLQQLATKRQQKPTAPRPRIERQKTMGFRDKVNAAKENKAEGEPAAEPSAEASATAADGATEPTPAPAARKPRAARKPDADGPDIAISVDGGPSLVLPKSSPLYAQASAVFAALYPEG